jgi:hypothetical protein
MPGWGRLYTKETESSHVPRCFGGLLLIPLSSNRQLPSVMTIVSGGARVTVMIRVQLVISRGRWTYR